jgi:hypothetical protein
LVETVRTADGPRQRRLCYLGELNGNAQTRWLKTVEVFNEQGESCQLKLFPSEVEPPHNEPNIARVVLNKVRLERVRQFGNCFVGLELWRRLGLDRFYEQLLDAEAADVAWSRVAAVLAINRLCAPGSELSIEQRWYPDTALDDLLGIEQEKINDTRLYRCLDRLLPHKKETGAASKATLWGVVRSRVRRTVVRLNEQLRRRRCGSKPDDATRVVPGSPAGL